jgi:hypothetical protein
MVRIKKMVVFTVFYLFFIFTVEAQQKLIPLLISDHHADHLEFFFRHGDDASAALIVVDAHTDITANEHYGLIRAMAKTGNYSQAVELAGNHNWLHPLCPYPVRTLAWISEIHSFPADSAKAFLYTHIIWDMEIKTIVINIDELRYLDLDEEILFVSIDLDFFYRDRTSPDDVQVILDSLLAFSSNWKGPVAWGICLSRPWLPDDNYAWTLLEKTLTWIHSQSLFGLPEITVFDSPRTDTSNLARHFRTVGWEIPVLHEKDIPGHIMKLIQELKKGELDGDFMFQ